jgi:hypothetical protein
MKSQHQIRKMSRANWWFQQMREVVDKAIDWQPENKPAQPISENDIPTQCHPQNKPNVT